MNFIIQNKTDLISDLWLFCENTPFYKVPSNCTSRFRFDFWILAQAVNYIDRSELRKTTKDGWTRDLDLSIPVHNLTDWNNNKKLWEKLLIFLTGDRWRLSFIQTLHPIAEPTPDLLDSRDEASISLLSGGLDSLIGAIDLLANNQYVFFSNSGEPALAKNIYNHLKNNYPTSILGYKNHIVHRVKGENTQRARSLLFLANALIDMDYQTLNNYHVNKIIIPENGFIGINLPLSFARLGSASTKTAHPFYLKKLEELWCRHGLNISLQNPYQLKTKGEMLVECINQNILRQLIPQTMSCAHPKKLVSNNTRYHSGKELHCAYCWPCLIRRASMAHYRSHNNIEDTTRYVDLNTTGLGVSQKDYYILKRFLHSATNTFNNLQNGSLYIRTPNTQSMKTTEIQNLMQRGVSELRTLFN